MIIMLILSRLLLIMAMPKMNGIIPLVPVLPAIRIASIGRITGTQLAIPFGKQKHHSFTCCIPCANLPIITPAGITGATSFRPPEIGRKTIGMRQRMKSCPKCFHIWQGFIACFGFQRIFRHNAIVIFMRVIWKIVN